MPFQAIQDLCDSRSHFKDECSDPFLGQQMMRPSQHLRFRPLCIKLQEINSFDRRFFTVLLKGNHFDLFLRSWPENAVLSDQLLAYERAQAFKGGLVAKQRSETIS